MEQQYNLQRVLNPRAYLSKKERLIPRLDKRKLRLKKDIQECLHLSKNYNDFERRMRAKKYVILKGRGIAFIDEKKVKIKGSEVNYSLQTIERILEKQRLFLEGRSAKKEQFTWNDNSHLRINSEQINKQGSLPAGNLVKEASAIVEQIIKPEHFNDPINHQLLKKKRKRKRQFHHL
jgi:hypothetical protein